MFHSLFIVNTLVVQLSFISKFGKSIHDRVQKITFLFSFQKTYILIYGFNPLHTGRGGHLRQNFQIKKYCLFLPGIKRKNISYIFPERYELGQKTIKIPIVKSIFKSYNYVMNGFIEKKFFGIFLKLYPPINVQKLYCAYFICKNEVYHFGSNFAFDTFDAWRNLYSFGQLQWGYSSNVHFTMLSMWCM